MGKDISAMSPQSGRTIKENGEFINTANILEAVYDAVNGVLKTSAALTYEGDITIGAVELKDAETGNRAMIGSDGSLKIKLVSGNNTATINANGSMDTNIVALPVLPTGSNVIGKFIQRVGAVDVGSTNQLPTNVSEFEISKEITLSAGASVYTANDIINNLTDATLPELDFGAIIGSASARKIQINSIQITSSNGAAATKLVPEVVLYNANALTGQVLTDNAVFNPTYAQHVLKKATAFSKNENWNVDFNYGAFYEVRLTELVRNATLDSAGKLFLALIATNAYTPAASEKFTITIKFYLLN